MAELEPMHYPAPPPERGEWIPYAAARFGGWAGLLVLVGLVAGLVAMQGAAESDADPEPNLPVERVDQMVEYQARMLVGQHDFGMADDAGTLTALRIEFSRPIDQLALDITTIHVTDRSERQPLVEALAQRRQDQPHLAEIIDALVLADGQMLEPEQHTLLEAHMGWFAGLVEAGGCSVERDLDPTFRDQMRQTAAVMGAFGLLVFIAVIGGCALGVWALVAWLQQRLVFRFRPEPDPRSAYLTVTTLWFFGFIVCSSVLQMVGWMPAGYWLFLLFFPVLLAWLVLQHEPPRVALQRLGCHRGQGVLREIGAGLLGYLAGMPIILVGFAATWLLAVWLSAGKATHEPMEQMINGGVPWWLLLSVGALFAPLNEEIFFRGALYRHLRANRSWWLAGLISGMIFAAIHPQGLVGLPGLCAIGMVLAGIREWRGSLIGCMAAHAVHNAVLLSMALVIARL